MRVIHMQVYILIIQATLPSQSRVNYVSYNYSFSKDESVALLQKNLYSIILVLQR